MADSPTKPKKTSKSSKPLQPSGAAAAAVVEGRVKVRDCAGLDTASDRFHLWCDNGFQAHHRCKKGLDPDERRHQLYDKARVAFSCLPAGTLLVCEEPIVIQNGKTARLLSLSAGAIWAAHLECRIFWAWADIAAWKLKVIGKGNADKEDIKVWVQENMGLEFPEDEPDYWDAAAIARYGKLCIAL